MANQNDKLYTALPSLRSRLDPLSRRCSTMLGTRTGERRRTEADLASTKTLFYLLPHYRARSVTRRMAMRGQHKLILVYLWFCHLRIGRPPRRRRQEAGFHHKLLLFGLLICLDLNAYIEEERTTTTKHRDGTRALNQRITAYK